MMRKPRHQPLGLRRASDLVPCPLPGADEVPITVGDVFFGFARCLTDFSEVCR